MHYQLVEIIEHLILFPAYLLKVLLLRVVESVTVLLPEAEIVLCLFPQGVVDGFLPVESELESSE